MHEFIKTDNWQYIYDNYESTYLDGLNGRFLIRKWRVDDDSLHDGLNDMARAYQTAQRQDKEWDERVWFPFLDEIKTRAVNDKIVLHAKPTHEYTGDQNKWWAWDYSKMDDRYGWRYSFDWIEEPNEKINHDLGQKLYELDRYQRKFGKRVFMLQKLLEKYLLEYVYRIYNYEWLYKNQFSGKSVKITLRGDEYWYRIAMNKHGVSTWENFIWQSNQTEEINL
jgi:hypothetical protein